jgi:creatinine amidohydrolase
MKLILAYITVSTFISLSCYAQDTSAADLTFNNTMVQMTWQQVQNAGQRKAIVLVPISVVEEHGPHMDLNPDILLTSILCSMMKSHLEKDSILTVIAPPYYWGINISTGSFPGSFNLKPETMKLVLTEIIENMQSWGFERFYLVNFHGDPTQISTISGLASDLTAKGWKVFDVRSLPAPPNPPTPPQTPPGMYSPDYHAGAFETKQVFDFAPNVVNTGIVGMLTPQRNFQPLGYVGDPANYLVAPGKGTTSFLAEYWAKSIISSMPVTSVPSSNNQALPKESKLLQNYPNPFNPSTTIEFQIPPTPFSEKGERGGFVSLKVYDILGCEVATLVDGYKHPGNYSVRWNAEGVSSGVYFYRLETGKNVQVKKLTLVK